MKRAFSLGLIFGCTALIAAACSANGGDGPSGDGDSNANGDGDGDLPGDGDGSGGTMNDIELTPMGGTDGGMSVPPDGTGVFVDPPLTECESRDDCCDAIDSCSSPSEYICTVDGYCGRITEACSEQADCQADTYCCSGPDCLGVGGTDGVCIPANVPPGAACTENVELGVFAPSVQCEWVEPAPTDPVPGSKNVSMTPLVADLPIPSGEVSDANPDGTSAEIVIITWELGNGDGSASAPGVIRIIDGQNCELLHSIVDTTHNPRAISTPALADLNNDGNIEIVARRNDGGIVAYRWNGTDAYEYYWHSTTEPTWYASGQRWDGVSVHDLDNDGLPEVILKDVVYNGRTGAVLSSAPQFYGGWNGPTFALGDFDNDGQVEIAGNTSNQGPLGLRQWNPGTGSWDNDRTLTESGTHFAFADFGTEGATADDFDPTVLDGIAEVVSVDEVDNGAVRIHTVTSGHLVLESLTGDRGGPPNVGDFDGDGFPEVGVAGGNRYRVFDFDVAGDHVLWSQQSQDLSSTQTGSTIFDFDGDGQSEVVYADECFLRVYDGTSGTVLFSSYRTSTTWYESPLVADVDKDQNTEIVVNNNVLGGATCSAGVDGIHPGIPCDTDAECPATSTCGEGYCRCGSDADCQGAGGSILESGLTCASPVAPATGGDVCRATHPGTASAKLTGIRVLRDSLDRWASSRSIWNQHAYSITNVNDDGSIPRTSEWASNWTQEGMNNYRANRQGEAGFSDLPDITGRFSDDEPCVTGSSSSKVYLQATVCNRGKRSVGSELPATFYRGNATDNDVLCTSYTDGPVPTGGCKLVFCEVGSDAAGTDVTIVVNDDGNGGRSTVECRPDNNSDSITVQSCAVEVPR